MVEPTETESKETIDAFIDEMIAIPNILLRGKHDLPARVEVADRKRQIVIQVQHTLEDEHALEYIHGTVRAGVLVGQQDGPFFRLPVGQNAIAPRQPAEIALPRERLVADLGRRLDEGVLGRAFGTGIEGEHEGVVPFWESRQELVLQKGDVSVYGRVFEQEKAGDIQ